MGVDLQPVDSAPTITVPGTTTAIVDTPKYIPGIVINDVDAGSDHEESHAGILKLTLSAAHGRMSLQNLQGLQMVQGDGLSNRYIECLGSLTSLNSAVDNMIYRCAHDEKCSTGTDVIVVHVNDNGFTGTGGALTATKNIQIAIAQK